MWARQRFMCQERRKKNTASTTRNYIYSVSVIQIGFSIFCVTCDRHTTQSMSNLERRTLTRVAGQNPGCYEWSGTKTTRRTTAEINNLLCTLTSYWSESEIIDHFVASVIDACIVTIATQKVRSLVNNAADTPSPSFRSALINKPGLPAEQILNTLLLIFGLTSLCVGCLMWRIFYFLYGHIHLETL